MFSPKLIDTLIFSRNPGNRAEQYQQIVYPGNVIGGRITNQVKLIGDVFLPMGSYISGKCKVKDVKIPYNTQIISLSIHNEHDKVGQIGDYKLVKEFRVARGVYVNGLIIEDDYYSLKRHIIIGYDLSIFGRSSLTINRYKETQKKKEKE